MMRFMAIRKADKRSESGQNPSTQLLAAMASYTAALQHSGLSFKAAGLYPSSAGIRMTFAGGRASIIQGPFLHEKELVAGVMLLDTHSRQEALEWLSRWPQPDSDVEFNIELRECGCPGGLAGMDLTGDSGEGKPRFMVILKTNAEEEAGVIASTETLARMGAHNQQSEKAGIMVAGEGLQPSAKGARIKFSGGKSATIVDGPFSEAKEMIAGYWLLQVASIQEAVDWAANYPFPFGEKSEVEIRQVLAVSNYAAALMPGLAENPANFQENDL